MGSVPHLWTVKLCINICVDGYSGEPCLMFASLFSLYLSVFSLVENKETEALFMSLLNLQCSSVSLYLSVPGAAFSRPLYCLVFF